MPAVGKPIKAVKRTMTKYPQRFKVTKLIQLPVVAKAEHTCITLKAISVKISFSPGSLFLCSRILKESAFLKCHLGSFFSSSSFPVCLNRYAALFTRNALRYRHDKKKTEKKDN